MPGYPMIISESSWVPPLIYQSEGAFLVNIVQSLIGIYGFYWFSIQELQWLSLGKWVLHNSELLGNFSAASLIYRQDYIQRGKIVIDENLWLRQYSLIAETPTFNPNQNRLQTKSVSSLYNKLNPLAC